LVDLVLSAEYSVRSFKPNINVDRRTVNIYKAKINRERMATSQHAQFRESEIVFFITKRSRLGSLVDGRTTLPTRLIDPTDNSKL